MKIQNLLTIIVIIACVKLHGVYSDVSMPDPDIIESMSDASPTVGTRSPLTSPTSDKKKKSSKKSSKKNKKNKSATPAIVTKVAKPITVKKEPVTTLPTNVYLVDAIEAVVFAPEGTKIVTHSELARPSLDGRMRTLDDLVYERLMILDAQKFKMIPDEDIIDKHLAAVQRDNNLTLDDLKNVFKSAGYSYEEGREQFGMISVINQVLDFKIRSRLIVPEREVVAYHNAHPETRDASYQIQVGTIAYAYSETREEQRESINRALHENIGMVEIEWQAPFWIEKNEIADDKQFLISMAPGTISEPIETNNGFQVFKKIEDKPEHTLTLEERYRDISDILRRPKYEQLYNDYKQQLMDVSSVKYLNS